MAEFKEHLHSETLESGEKVVKVLGVTCKCGEKMRKITFPDIGLCWSCSDLKCREYIVIEDYENSDV